jgi:hypothetical protein
VQELADEASRFANIVAMLLPTRKPDGVNPDGPDWLCHGMFIFCRGECVIPRSAYDMCGTSAHDMRHRSSPCNNVYHISRGCVLIAF